MCFLVDTGAQISFIRKRHVLNTDDINTEAQFQIKGIIPSVNRLTCGTTTMKFLFNSILVETTFHVVPDDIVNGCNGIIGGDFLNKFNCLINYETECLKIKIPRENESKTISQTLQERRKTKKEVNLKKRSENIVTLKVNTTDDVVIEKNEIEKGIHIANAIVTPNENNEIRIAILNTNDNDCQVKLNNENIRISKLSDYDLIKSNASVLSLEERMKKIKELINISHCNSEEKKEILKICYEFHEVFHLKGDKLSITSAATHKIPLLPGTIPINTKPYRLPYHQKENLQKEIQQLLDDEIIRPSKSPWCSPILLVSKKLDKSGVKKWRLCIDFRKINDKTINDAYPLPQIAEILDSLGKAMYFSTLDLERGYWQVPMDPKDSEITAFKANNRLYEWLRMPMGVKGASATFQRMMNNVLTGLQGEICLVYIDDVIVYGANLVDHNEKLKLVLDRFKENKLKIRPDKCYFLKKEVNYLGHIISKAGITVDPKKIEAIKLYPIPRTQRQIRAFCGLVSYYRRFCSNLSGLLKPINKLLQKDIAYEWSEECNDAFELIKEKLTTSPILIFPDFTKQFNIRCDASNYGVGAILSQGKIREDLPIAYMSKSLNKHEIRYATVEKELLAIIYALRAFRPYIFSSKTLIITDHEALVWIMKLKNPASRLWRWKLEMSEYDLEIIHRPGILNANADALSRIQITPEELLGEEPQENKLELKYPKEIAVTTRNQMKNRESIVEENQSKDISDERAKNMKYFEEIDCLNFKESDKILSIFVITNDLDYPANIIDEGAKIIEMENNSIQNYASIIIVKFKNNNCETQTSKMKELWRSIQQFCVRHKWSKLAIFISKADTEFYFKNQILLNEIFNKTDCEIKLIINDIIFVHNEQEKQNIIHNFHNNILGGHLGIQATTNKIKRQYFWPGMSEDIKKCVNNCLKCKKNKIVTHTKMPMKITSAAKHPFDRVQMDCVGPIPESNSGNRFMITFQDELTKYAECIATPNITAYTVAKFFVERIICRYGIPNVLLTDLGSNFTSEMFDSVCKMLKIEHINSTAYHPQTMGQIERYHRTLGQYLKIFTEEDRDNWDEWIPFALLTYNSNKHSTTNFSPNFLIYGYEIDIPCNLKRNPNPIYNYENYALILKNRLKTSHEIAKKNIQDKKVSNKRLYDEMNNNSVNFQIGDSVLIYNETKNHKFDENYSGPFQIIDIPSDENCLIQMKKRQKLIHKNKLKRA